MNLHNLFDGLQRGHMPTAFTGLLVPGSGRLLGWGTTVGNGVENWAPGAIFIDYDAAADLNVWINHGNTTTATWVALEPAAGTFTAITGNDASLAIEGQAGSSGAGGAIAMAGGVGDSEAGGAVTIVGGAGNGAYNGGLVSVTGGASGVGATGNGGAVSLIGTTATSTAGAGGAVTITAGTGTTTGAAGIVAISAGHGGSTNVAGGAVTIDGGNGNVAGAANGGAIAAIAGDSGGGATGTGGAASLVGGTAVSTNGIGGQANLVGGEGNGNLAGGKAVVTGGAGGSGADTGAGGAIELTGGASAAGATGNGGAGYLRGGAATSTAGNGGAVDLTGGLGTTTGNGGAAAVAGGAGGNGASVGGAVTITGGASGGASGTSGAVTIDTGAVTGGTGAAVSIAPTNATHVDVGMDLRLPDSKALQLGTSQDVQMEWDTAKLTLGPSAAGLWTNCPLTQWAQGQAYAYELFDDFWMLDTTATVGGWVKESVAAETAAVNDAIGGTALLTNAGTTDNSGCQIRSVSKGFYLAAAKHLWFEARVRCAAGATEVDVAMGLSAGENLTAVADNMAADGIVIHKDDGATVLKLTASKAGTNTGANADIGTMTTGWHTYGFYVNGVTNITPYFDGTADDAITATIPDAVLLSPFFMVRNGDATTTQTLEIDYVKVVQLR